MSGSFLAFVLLSGAVPLQLQNQAQITVFLLAGSLWFVLSIVCRERGVVVTGPSLCVLLVSSWTQQSVIIITPQPLLSGTFGMFFDCTNGLGITLKRTTHAKSCLWWRKCCQRINQVETLIFDLQLLSLTFLLKQLLGYIPICCWLSATAVCCSQLSVGGRSTIH